MRMEMQMTGFDSGCAKTNSVSMQQALKRAGLNSCHVIYSCDCYYYLISQNRNIFKWPINSLPRKTLETKS